MLLHAFPSMFVSSLREFPENCVYKHGGLNCFIEYLHIINDHDVILHGFMLQIMYIKLSMLVGHTVAPLIYTLPKKKSNM
jgi:hypothetical protein